MRPEKEFLVKEAATFIDSSNFFFLTDYKGIDAEETGELRKALSVNGAEFHVVKNSSLKIATKEKGIDLGDHLNWSHRDCFWR